LKEERLARVHSQLGLDPPFSLQWAGYEESCMTAVVSIIAAGPECLRIYADNGCMEAVDMNGRVPDRPRNVWLRRFPKTPGSQKLAFGSPAESAVVDLLHLQVQELFSAREETAFVRAEFRSRHPKKGDPDYHYMVWLSSLTPQERLVLDLRAILAQIEFRRREALRPGQGS
jgi:hypothetical protein